MNQINSWRFGALRFSGENKWNRKVKMMVRTPLNTIRNLEVSQIFFYVFFNLNVHADPKIQKQDVQNQCLMPNTIYRCSRQLPDGQRAGHLGEGREGQRSGRRTRGEHNIHNIEKVSHVCKEGKSLQRIMFVDVAATTFSM